MAINNRFPDFLVVGAHRSGTTSLYIYLKQHPQIFLPKIKEPLFFTFANRELFNKYKADLLLSETITDIEDYLNLFREAKTEQIIGEISPLYLFFYKETISNIKRFHPHWQELKIVIILRHPIDKTISHYNHVRLQKIERLEFLEALKAEKDRLRRGLSPIRYGYITLSKYSDQIKAYLETFPNTKILLFENLVMNPSETIKDLIWFLGVDNGYVQNMKFKIFNISGVPKYNWLEPICAILFAENFLKKILRKIIPYHRRILLRHYLQKIFLKRKKNNVDKKVLRYLYEALGEDLKKTYSILESLKINCVLWKEKDKYYRELIGV